MNIRITSSNKHGEAYLVLAQGDIEETVNLTGSFDSFIDMSRFAPGKIAMSFLYEDAGEVTVDMHLSIL